MREVELLAAIDDSESGDKSFRPNPLVGGREQLENPVTLPEIVESTSGQAEVKRPKRGQEGRFLPGPSAGKQTGITPKVQHRSSSRTPLFLPPDSSNYHNQAVDSNYAFLSLQPGDGRSHGSKGKVRSRVAFAYLNLK
ncbi:hypothetical protein BTVI_100531 [Pitangus sulphuratus]|nr:hypothetical protein BTVI_100531 [Pitangus sulphuratus]